MRIGEVTLERRGLDLIDGQRREQQRIATQRLAITADDVATLALDALGDSCRIGRQLVQSTLGGGHATRARSCFFWCFALGGSALALRRRFAFGRHETPPMQSMHTDPDAISAYRDSPHVP